MLAAITSRVVAPLLVEVMCCVEVCLLGCGGKFRPTTTVGREIAFGLIARLCGFVALCRFGLLSAIVGRRLLVGSWGIDCLADRAALCNGFDWLFLRFNESGIYIIRKPHDGKYSEVNHRTSGAYVFLFCSASHRSCASHCWSA